MILVCLSLMNKDIEYLFTYLLFIHISSFMSFSSQIFCPCFYGAVCLLLHFLLQPTPVVLLGKSHGQRSVVGYSPWGCKESDTTEPLYFLLSSSYWWVLRVLGMFWIQILCEIYASLVAQMVKNLPAIQDPWVPRGGDGNSLQYSCLENSMDREAWRTTWGLKE